jgi:phosphate transport system substrate-binding protein
MWKAFLTLLCLQEALAASSLRIVGSSTIFPFAATVAEHFHYKTNEPTPIVESTGTGAGVKLFCGSTGSPDGVVASRPMTESERMRCEAHNVTYQEFKIGQDGLVIFQNKAEDPIALTLKDLTEALDEKTLQNSTCIPNPHKTWKEIHANLPNDPIRVLGPAPTSGTYDILREKIGGTCGPYFRHDGAYIEAPTNENLIIQKVINASNTVGIVTYSYFERNKDRLNANAINGILPTLESIHNGQYPLSRDLYLYMKTNGSDPSRAKYAQEFTSPDAIGASGYLNKKGLIPLSDQVQEEMHKRALDIGNSNSSIPDASLRGAEDFSAIQQKGVILANAGIQDNDSLRSNVMIPSFLR